MDKSCQEGQYEQEKKGVFHGNRLLLQMDVIQVLASICRFFMTKESIIACWLTFDRQYYTSKIIINSMKQSRNIQHRQTLLNMPAPRSNLASLKAIMNQGRVPLGQYINQKPNKNRPLRMQQMSYIDKMKAMLYNGSKGMNLESEDDQPQKMEVQEVEDKLEKYLFQYQNPNKISQRKYNGQVGYSRGKQRSMSSYGTYSRQPSTYKKLPPNCPTSNLAGQHIKSAKTNIKERVHTQQTSVQTDLKPERKNIFTKFGKQVKRQKVDYRKYTSLLGGTDQISVLELEEILGSGASATVRAAKDKKSGQYAVKIYDKYKLIEPKRMKRVMQEISILSKLDHPNIIKLIHCFQDKRQIHLIFEYVEGAQTLHQHIRNKGYSVEAEEQHNIAVGIADAIAYLHQMGISHRDIKTDNVIIGANGEVKVIDFGFATTLTKGQSHCGTPNYMAPELFQKNSIYNPTKVDAWALAVLLFYLYQGSYPFRGYSEKQLSRNILACNYTFSKCYGWPRSVIENTLVVDSGQRLTVEQMLGRLKS